MNRTKLSDMLLPRPAAAWLLTGPGLPNKVTIGSLDCPPDVMIDIVNRLLSQGRYEHATRIIGGAIAIPATFAKNSGDQSYTGAGGEFAFVGNRPADSEFTPKLTTTMRLESDLETTVWQVHTSHGNFIFVMPHPDQVDRSKADNLALDLLQDRLSGECVISRIDTGQFTTLPNMQSSEIGLILAEP